jgi:hypothetical protein
LPAERVETLGVGPRSDWKPVAIPLFVDTCRREGNPRRGVLEQAALRNHAILVRKGFFGQALKVALSPREDQDSFQTRDL